jgi:hypothetical protein
MRARPVGPHGARYLRSADARRGKGSGDVLADGSPRPSTPQGKKFSKRTENIRCIASHKEADLPSAVRCQRGSAFDVSGETIGV